MSVDPRVAAATAHWSHRFVTNGVPLADFQDVTGSITRWEEWCGAWVARAARHEAMGEAAAAAGHLRSAAEHFSTAAVEYHFGKFLNVHDIAEMKAAHARAPSPVANRALPNLDPPGDARRRAATAPTRYTATCAGRPGSRGRRWW